MLTVPLWINVPCWGTLLPADLGLQPLLTRRHISLGRSEVRRDRIRVSWREELWQASCSTLHFTDDKIEASWPQGASSEGTCSTSHSLLSVEQDLVPPASKFFLNHADLFLLVYKGCKGWEPGMCVNGNTVCTYGRQVCYSFWGGWCRTFAVLTFACQASSGKSPH